MREGVAVAGRSREEGAEHKEVGGEKATVIIARRRRRGRDGQSKDKGDRNRGQCGQAPQAAMGARHHDSESQGIACKNKRRPRTHRSAKLREGVP